MAMNILGFVKSSAQTQVVQGGIHQGPIVKIVLAQKKVSAVSFLLAGILIALPACENRRDADAVRKMANASQRHSSEGLALIGLFALMKLRECSEHPDAPCAFRDPAQSSAVPSKPTKLRKSAHAGEP